MKRRIGGEPRIDGDPWIDGESRIGGESRIPFILSLSAVAIGFLTNLYFSIDTGFGITFLVGNVFGVFAALISPWPWGIFGPLLTMTPTLMLWGHPWALLSVLLEGLFLASLGRQGTYERVLIYEIWYWPLVGAPLVLLQYVLFLRMDFSGALAAATKQGINSIYNAVFALILFYAVRGIKSLFSRSKNTIHAQEYLLLFLNFAILLPLLIGVGIYMVVQRDSTLRSAEAEASKIASLMATEMGPSESSDGEEGFLRRFKAITGFDWAVYSVREDARVLDHGSFTATEVPWYLGSDVTILTSLGNASVVAPNRETNPMKRWAVSVVLARQTLGTTEVLVSRPIKNDVNTFNQSISLIFLFLFVWLAVMGSLAFALATMIMRPLEGLRRSAELTQRGESSVVWPKTSVSEINELRDSLVAMTGALEQRNLELREAKNAAERMTRLSEKYLSFMGHELKSPLAAIYSVLETLAIPMEIDIRGSINRLLELIDDILDQAKSSSGKLTLRSEPFSPAQEAKNLLEPFAIRSRRRNLEFTLTVGPELHVPVLGDPLRFRQILSNLVGNALKYTASGSIRVDLTGITVNNTLEVHGWVRDTGRGINAEKLQDIWKPFASVETKTEDGQSSHGLGLSIVHGIVEAMGGEIQVSSTEGQGSLFSFRIAFPLVTGSEAEKPTVSVLTGETNRSLSIHSPASVPIQEPPPSPVPIQAAPNSPVLRQEAPKTPDLRGLRVLVAEDEKIARMVVVYLFRSWGAQVDEAEDGKVALELWKVRGHDIVVLDDHMGGLEGPEVIRRIRDVQGERKPLLIISSADMAFRDPSFVLEGADATLPKPVNENRLMKIIGDFF